MVDGERGERARTPRSPAGRGTELRRRLVDRIRARRRRPFWALMLLVGFVTGTFALAGVECTIQDRLGDVDVPAGPVDLNPDLTITLSPGLLTALIRQSIERGQSPVPLDDAQVRTSDGKVVLTGAVEVLGRGVDAVIEMRPVIEDGKIRMKVTRAKLGPLPVPGNIERIAEVPINQRVEAAIAGYPATITSVRAGSEGVTVTARTRPEEFRPPPTPVR